MRTDAKITAARRMRKALTKPEVWLWVRLRQRNGDGIYFRKQHPIGPYILDFYCPKVRLCVEVDGADHTRDENQRRDAIRDQWLTEQDIFTYRITAGSLLEDPDEAADGVFNLVAERLRKL